MNTFKKIIALVTVVFFVIRLFIISVSASFAAPVMAEETLKLLFIEALGSSGSYNMDDLEAWEYDDLRNEFEIQMTTNPNFKPKKSIPYLVFPNAEDIPGTPENVEKIQEGIINLRKQNDKIIADWLAGSLGENIYDNIHPTYNSPYIDIPSSGAVIEVTDSLDQHRIIYLNDYGLKVLNSDGHAGFMIRQNIMVHQVIYDKHGKLVADVSYDTPSNSQMTYSLIDSSVKSIQIYGDWRYDEDTPTETDDTAVPVIGEVAGTQVTPDMLNPDGTVTIDGTTYSPSDFIDWDKFKDNAIIDLLNDILSKIDTALIVSEQDKPLVDVDEIEVTVPEELSDFTVPIGIANFFPFCLPWDFVRGIKMLLAKPEIPVFKTKIDLTDFCGYDLGVIPVKISFEKWEPAIIIVRWFFLLLFIIALIILTPKICKGAG